MSFRGEWKEEEERKGNDNLVLLCTSVKRYYIVNSARFLQYRISLSRMLFVNVLQ